MNRALKSALYELKADGITLDPIADLDHILALNTLALRISTPENPPGEKALLQPVLKIGNLTLRHLSMGAKRFLIDVVAAWIPGDYRDQDLAYAFAMSLTDTPEALWALQGDRRAFLKALRCWERTVNVPYERLKAAIAEFMGGPEGEPDQKPRARDYVNAIALLHAWRPMPEPYHAECDAAAAALMIEASAEPAQFGWLIEMLVREYPGSGKTAEDWFWRTPEKEIEAILHNRNEREGAEARSCKGARDDRFQRAHYSFRSYVDLIRKAKKVVTP